LLRVAMPRRPAPACDYFRARCVCIFSTITMAWRAVTIFSRTREQAVTEIIAGLHTRLRPAPPGAGRCRGNTGSVEDGGEAVRSAGHRWLGREARANQSCSACEPGTKPP